MEPILVCGLLPLLDLFEIAEHESHPFAFRMYPNVGDGTVSQHTGRSAVAS
jgi:hypothetical protein